VRISDVLRAKGDSVVTVRPETDIRQLLAMLAEHRIGAVVVSQDGETCEGIVSERDIVRGLADRGASVLSEPVSEVATTNVHMVEPKTPIDDVMRLMTEERIRHVPVVAEGKLRGIVSIGDVVKIRIVELERDREALSNYISTGR
jgi:CBS domain-containing protein